MPSIEVAKKFDEVIRRLSTAFTPVLDGLEATITVAGTNYAQYNESQKRQVYLAVQFAQILALLLKTSLMTEQGTLQQIAGLLSTVTAVGKPVA